MMPRLKTPFHVALAVTLLITALFGLIASFLAFMAIDQAVDRTLQEEIRRDIEVLTDRAPEQAALPKVASATTNIGRRLFLGEVAESQSVYLLVRPDRSVIVGNAKVWPKTPLAEDDWVEIDGQALGLASGSVLIRTTRLDGGHSLLVGRRLTARTALSQRFVPALIGAFVLFGSLTSLLLLWLDRRYRRRVQIYNRVFSEVQTGDLTARVPARLLDQSGDDLAILGGHVNDALEEVERLLSGLDAYSQVAAHELNLAVSKMRARFMSAGDTRSVAEADRLLDLVVQILDLAKIEATPGFAMQRVSLNEVANSVCDLFDDAFEEEGVVLERSLEPGNVVILCSRPLIESALSNLVSNALKHSPAGSIVKLKLQRDQKRLRLSVRDHGPGVVDTEIDALAALGQSQQSSGNGFGLRHAQAVAIRHGAKIVLENKEPGLEVSLLFKSEAS